MTASWTAWEALRRAGFDAGSTVGIVGGAPVGLVITMLAVARCDSSVIVVDVDDRRLAVATDFGAANACLLP